MPAPIWSDNSGNHSWTAVCGPRTAFHRGRGTAHDKLDGPVCRRATTGPRDNPRYAIQAVSYRRTPVKFRLAWDPSIDYVFAVDVTDRYAKRQ